MNPNRVLGVITILCFLFISAAVIIASSSVATGHELSIYTETPATAWVFLFTCVSGGTLLISYCAITGKEVDHLGLVIGPLGLANLTVLLLLTLRGYYLYASPDSLARMGMGDDKGRWFPSPFIHKERSCACWASARYQIAGEWMLGKTSLR